MIVHNLATNESMVFSDSASTLYAVCYAWAADNNCLTLWTNLVHKGANVVQIKAAGFPVVVGAVSIACGAWATI
jgi:hypothetical protein